VREGCSGVCVSDEVRARGEQEYIQADAVVPGFVARGEVLEFVVLAH